LNPFKEKFLFLLLSILLFFVLRPFIEGYARIGFLLDLFFSFILFSGVYAVSEKKVHFIIVLFIALAEFVIAWSMNFVEVPSLVMVRDSLSILLFAYLMIIILAHVFRQDVVTTDLIMGAVCVYFFLGLMWAFVFSLLESVQPGSFLMGQGEPPHRSEFVYYSFVTQTTLGYGEITPLTPPARSLAILEAIFGQFYVAILIARLVGIHISQSYRH